MTQENGALQLRVAIADDHPIVVRGIEGLLMQEQRFKVVGTATNSQGLVSILQSVPVEVVITDYSMPSDAAYGDGMRLISYIRRNFPHIRIIVMTMITNEIILNKLTSLGQLKVVRKSGMTTRLIQSLDELCLLSRYSAQQEFDQNELKDDMLSVLTPMETETIRMILSGMKNAEISRATHRSPKTISGHKISAMRKLGVTTDSELFETAILLGWFK